MRQAVKQKTLPGRSYNENISEELIIILFFWNTDITSSENMLRSMYQAASQAALHMTIPRSITILSNMVPLTLPAEL